MSGGDGPAGRASVAELAGHPFLRGMPGNAVARLARHCSVTLAAAGHRIFEEGGIASRFWLLRSGHVALDVHPPTGALLIVETLGRGDLLGLSWLAPPYQWQFGAMAVTDTVAFELDAAAVRAACEADAALGYELLRRVMSAASSRLQASRIRMLDLYSASSGAGSGS